MSDYNIATLLQLNGGIPYENIVPLTSPNSTGISLLGTPIIDELKVEPFAYATHKNGNKYDVSYSGYDFEAGVIMQVALQKNIVETPVHGRQGTVKELISSQDYAITISGFIVAKDQQPPYTAMADLDNVLKIPSSLPIRSRYLAAFGINGIVIKSYEIGLYEASQNSAKFTITAVSDAVFELTINPYL